MSATLPSPYKKFDTLSIVQALRDDLSAKLEASLKNWGTTTMTAIEQVVADWIAGLDSGSLETWLSWLGLPIVVIDAIKAVLAAGGDLGGTLSTFGVERNVIAIQTHCAPRSAWRPISPMCTDRRSLL